MACRLPRCVSATGRPAARQLTVYSICTLRIGSATPLPVFVISIVSFYPSVRDVFVTEPSETVPNTVQLPVPPDPDV